MSRPRFTTAQSMVVVIYVGFGFAALRNADGLWPSATFTLAVIMVTVAFVGALAREGNFGRAWAGFCDRWRSVRPLPSGLRPLPP